MNILITVNTYEPHKDGVQFVTKYIAEGLVRKGHTVTLVTVNYGDKPFEVINEVKVYRVNVSINHTLYFGEINKYRNTIKELSSEMDWMINVCTQNALTDLLFPILNELKCKKMLYLHGIYSYNWNRVSSIQDVFHKVWNDIRWGLYYKTKGSFFKQYDSVVNLHEFDYASVYFKEHYGIIPHFIGNAVEDAFFEEENQKDKYAIFVGNYDSRKNQKDLIKAFYMSDIPDDFSLILIGSNDNNYYHECELLRDDMNKSVVNRNVQLLYGLSRKETISYIKNAYVVLMASKWEAYPISIIEGLASSVPFISTNVGCVKYLPGGVVVNSIEEMSYWISMLVKNQEITDFLGLAGNIYAKKYCTIESKVNAINELLESL